MTKVVLVFLFSLLGAISIHNFYVSTTAIRFLPEENSIQITTQVFLDDFESVLQQQGNYKTKLIPKIHQKVIDSLVEDYFRENLTFKAQGKKIDFDFLGKRYKSDVLVAYMELEMDTVVSPFVIKNTIFFDYLPDQKNIIHLKLDSRRKSFLAVSSKSIFEVPKDFFESNN